MRTVEQRFGLEILSSQASSDKGPMFKKVKKRFGFIYLIECRSGGDELHCGEGSQGFLLGLLLMSEVFSNDASTSSSFKWKSTIINLK